MSQIDEDELYALLEQRAGWHARLDDKYITKEGTVVGLNGRDLILRDEATGPRNQPGTRPVMPRGSISLPAKATILFHNANVLIIEWSRHEGGRTDTWQLMLTKRM